MATVTYNYQYDLTPEHTIYDAAGYGAQNQALSDASGDNTFTSGEGIDNNGAPTDYTYVGHTSDGGLVMQNQYGGKIFYTNDVYPQGASVAYTSDPQTYCFVAGSLIQTPGGDRAVETLAIGDRVCTLAGASVPILWIGRQRRNPLFAALYHQLPIRIAASALGDGLPTRDLYVSPDHALLLDGCLVHAAALVNGRSIERMQSWEGDVEYFHIETEAHELILAEGAAAETFIDNVSREKFDNYAEFAELYPDAAPMTELDLPRICYARQLPRAIARKMEAVADQLLGAVAVAA